MKHSFRNGQPPVIVIHGGAGPHSAADELDALRNHGLEEAIGEAWSLLLEGETATDSVTRLVGKLEAIPYFNAGYGAVLQQDGMARLSASLMDGRKQKFSGVLLATHIAHPSKLAKALQDKTESVLGPLGAQLLARELGIPPENPVTAEQAIKWAESIEEKHPEQQRHGTVGAVVLDMHDDLAAATSTGGNRTNNPERVSDSASVAGNYASRFCAISCTGIGEQIVDDAVAARLESRVRDGKSVIQGSEKAYVEALDRYREYGWIAIDNLANCAIYSTTECMYWAAISRNGTEAGFT